MLKQALRLWHEDTYWPIRQARSIDLFHIWVHSWNHWRVCLISLLSQNRLHRSKLCLVCWRHLTHLIPCLTDDHQVAICGSEFMTSTSTLTSSSEYSVERINVLRRIIISTERGWCKSFWEMFEVHGSWRIYTTDIFKRFAMTVKATFQSSWKCFDIRFQEVALAPHSEQLTIYIWPESELILVTMRGNGTFIPSHFKARVTSISDRDVEFQNASGSFCKHSMSVCILLAVASLTVVVGVIYIVGKIIRSKSTRSRHFLFQYIRGDTSASGTRTHLYISGNRKTWLL